mgnify:CR=1 FL=1
MAKGEFVGLLDHDDLLAPNALYETVKILQDHPQADALYTDEDKVTTELDEHFQPHLKPDFNLDLLRSNNYICHFFVVRKSIVEKGRRFPKRIRRSSGLRFYLPLYGECERFYMFRKSCITGEHTKPPLQIILPVKCTHLKPAREQ